MSTPAVLGWSEGQPITSLQDLLDYWSAVGQHKLWLVKENVDRMRNDVTSLMLDVAYIRTTVDEIKAEIGDMSATSYGWDDTATALEDIKDEIVTIDTVVDAILVDTNELQTDWHNNGRLDVIIDATLADTNELQTDWTNNGRLDMILDNIYAAVDTMEADLKTWMTTNIVTNYLAHATYGLSALHADIATVDTVVDTTYTWLTTDANIVDDSELSAAQTAIIAQIDANEAKIDIIDGVVDDILDDTSDIYDAVYSVTYGLAEIKDEIIDIYGAVDTMEADLETWMTTNIVTNYLADATFGLSALHTDIAAIQTDTTAILSDTSDILDDTYDILADTSDIYDAVYDATYGLSALHTDITAIATEVGDISVDSGRVGWTTLGVALDDIKAEIEYIYDMVGYIEEDTMDIYDAVYHATYGLSAIHTDVTAIRAGDTVTSITGTDVVVTQGTSTVLITSGSSPFWGTLTIRGSDTSYSIEAYVGNNWTTILDPISAGNSITVSGTGLVITADLDASDVTVDYAFVYHSDTG